MAKNTSTDWSPFAIDGANRWSPVEGLRGFAEELTLRRDPDTGGSTRLTRFAPGADTRPLGPRHRRYPEELFVVSGRLYDAAFDQWLEAGHYEKRPPGETHGPFRTDEGCVVLVVSHPDPSREEPWPGPGI